MKAFCLASKGFFTGQETWCPSLSTPAPASSHWRSIHSSFCRSASIIFINQCNEDKFYWQSKALTAPGNCSVAAVEHSKGRQCLPRVESSCHRAHTSTTAITSTTTTTTMTLLWGGGRVRPRGERSLKTPGNVIQATTCLL